MNQDIEHILEKVEGQHIKDASRRLLDFIRRNKIFSLTDEAESLCREYDLMLSFVRRGFTDPKREELFRNLRERITKLATNADIMMERMEHQFYTARQKQIDQTDLSTQAIRNAMETYVSTLALADIDPTIDTKEVTRKHHDYVSMLFCHFCFDTLWTEKKRQEMVELLLSPTIEERDAAIIISAISLATGRFFDSQKWLMLTEIYEKSHCESVRQRALVGWVTSAHNITREKACEATVRRMCMAEETQDELIQLQSELIFAANADNDKETIAKDIMPGIMRNSNLKITGHGIEEMEDEDAESILNPEKMDKRMKELESYYERIRSMQNQGADVFYYGFSSMKRYAMFYNIANWFMPFYKEHPDIRVPEQGQEKYEAMLKVLENIPLCDSDKYSMAMGMQSALSMLSDSNIEMLKLSAESGNEVFKEETPERIRRNYIHSLYRFVKLFPQKTTFENPFERTFLADNLFCNAMPENKADDLMALLYKNKFYDQLMAIATKYAAKENTSIKTQLMVAKNYMRMGQYHNAIMIYVLINSTKRNIMEVRKGIAKAAMHTKKYDLALHEYQYISKMEPENITAKLNYYATRIYCNQAEEILDELFQLDFEEAEKGNTRNATNARRLLAWALLCVGRIDDALKRYDIMAMNGYQTTGDILNHAVALWLNNDTQESLRKLEMWAEETSASTGKNGEDDNRESISISEKIFREIADDMPLYSVYNKTELDLRLLCELI